MKKLIVLVLCVVFLLSAVSCANKPAEVSAESTTSASESQLVEAPPPSDSPSASQEASEEPSASETPEPSQGAQAGAGEQAYYDMLFTVPDGAEIEETDINLSILLDPTTAVSISIPQSGAGVTNDEFVSEPMYAEAMWTGLSMVLDTDDYELGTTTVDGIDALQFTYGFTQDGADMMSVTVSYVYDDSVYSLSLVTLASTFDSGYDLFEDFLSTVHMA